MDRVAKIKSKYYASCFPVETPHERALDIVYLIEKIEQQEAIIKEMKIKLITLSPSDDGF